jgi:hypothetical protein
MFKLSRRGIGVWWGEMIGVALLALKIMQAIVQYSA